MYFLKHGLRLLYKIIIFNIIFYIIVYIIEIILWILLILRILLLINILFLIWIDYFCILKFIFFVLRDNFGDCLIYSNILLYIIIGVVILIFFKFLRICFGLFIKIFIYILIHFLKKIVILCLIRIL